eukprot:5352606-Pleurochrysis_carterae.AAC.2
MKHCSHRSARCSHRAEAVRRLGVRHPGHRSYGPLAVPGVRWHVSMMAIALPSSACARGSCTTSSAVGAAAFTASAPP